MSFFHDYQNPTPSSPYDDYDSETDLKLDELDKKGERARTIDNGHWAVPKIQFKRLRPAGRNHHSEEGGEFLNDDDDLTDLLAPTAEPGPGSADEAGPSSVEHDQVLSPVVDADGEDDTPLLGSTRPAVRPSAMLRRTTSVSQVWAKLQANPRDEAEEGYDPSSARIINVGRRQTERYPPNAVSNAKYTPWSFLPRTLYNEFSFFFNLYFLLVALSQIIPALRIGYLSTYVAPLAFVLAVTLGKEAFDDIARRRRDAEANSERYVVISYEGQASENETRQLFRRGKPSGFRKDRLTEIAEEEDDAETATADKHAYEIREVLKSSRDLKVGDVIKLGKDARVPVDAVILKSSSNDASETSEVDTGGEAFIRTDQLDGETDWKLRLAPALTQGMDVRAFATLQIQAGMPENKVNEFAGSISIASGSASHLQGEDASKAIPLTIDNTAWANTVIASNAFVYAAVVYTGPQTRQALSTSASRSKTGLLEYEINSLTKILCALTLVLSVVLVILEGIESHDDSKAYISVMRFLILFSTIVPISLRVNLDMGKSVYAWFIQHDVDIPETVVRTSTIPEDLGRIEYLLSDKTGTLTQNGERSALLQGRLMLIISRHAIEEGPRWHGVLRQRCNVRSGIIRSTRFWRRRRRKTQQ